MKTPDKQIFAMLQAFKRKDVLAAIKLYQDGIENENQKAKQELLDNGWRPQKTKPENREFYFFGDEYWVQTDEAREADRQKAIEAMQNKSRPAVPQKQKKTTSAELKQAGLKCPKCGNKMYKQAVCPGCKEGKAGHKIRLICEDNPDHEVLL
jgi:hypothetical protein